jgi:hypothetical protein
LAAQGDTDGTVGTSAQHGCVLLSAFSVIVDAHSLRCCITGVAVGLAVAAAHGIPDIRATQGAITANASLQQTVLEETVLELAAFSIRPAVAWIALSLVVDVHPFDGGGASVAVGLAVATAHGLPDWDTSFGTPLTDT